MKVDEKNRAIKELIGEKEYMACSVGAVLYTPAINTSFVDKLINRSIEKITSIAICLEDSILDDAVEEAEENLVYSLSRLSRVDKQELPLIFVRIRTPYHLAHVHYKLGGLASVITGYILPKFDLSNAEQYCEIMSEINRGREKPIYFMPILESASVANPLGRHGDLVRIKNILDNVKGYILNIRVGGNDLCNFYGIRRPIDSTIYDIGVVRDVLVDVVAAFGRDYVVSGPVWEYFGDAGGEWEIGLRREIALDKLNGFTGKTAIHPTQLPVIYDCLAVSRTDYEDALRILAWDSCVAGVSASANKSRMNEVKCHANWAKRTVVLGEIYGVK